MTASLVNDTECQFDLHVVTISVIHKLKKSHQINKSVCYLPSLDKVIRNIGIDDSRGTELVVDTCPHRKQNVTSLHMERNQTKNSTYTEKPILALVDLPFLNVENVSFTHKVRKRKSVDKNSKLGSKKRKETHPNTDNFSPNEIVQKFRCLIQQGPEYICTSCSQLFFKHAVKKYTVSSNYSTLEKNCIVGIKSVDQLEWICISCSQCLKKGDIPQCSIGNGLKFPQIPDTLFDLTELEERLVSPRIPFMQIRELPRGGQHGIKGNVVNVPADVNGTIRLLPRGLNETETIPLKLKRSRSLNSHIVYQQIRPQKVLMAVKWLLKNSTLFKNENIQLNENWMYEISKQLEDNNTNHTEMAQCQKNSLTSDSSEEKVTDTDNWTENDELREPCANLDTCMQPADFREFNRIISVAPAEGNMPLGMFQDLNAEFLAFPKIYCGQTRENNNVRKVPVHYSTICKWELRNADRRVACCISNIFFKLKKLQIKQVSDKVSLALRKCKLKGKRLTVADILSSDTVSNIIKLDEGYKVLRTLRGSPPYWEQAKKDIFAMIRQLGLPTWFCSFSAAESKWSELLKILGKVLKGKNFTEEDILNLTWQEKCELIKSDPVTCTRYFDHRVQLFLRHVLQNDLCPIGKIRDFFYRVEFQQRDSPHIHMLLWITDAPSLHSHSYPDVASFVDKYVTCKKDMQIHKLVNYQTHRHARSCRKKGKSVCRFGFPLPPMKETMILTSLVPNSPERSTAEKNFNIIMTALEKMKLDENHCTYETFLKNIKLTKEEYIAALRSSIPAGKCKLFLKRSLSEIRINNYNTTLLKCWQANMDIQYILDPFSCAAYIVSYISKGQRGMSNLLHEACKAARESAKDIKEQVRHIGNVFLTNVEIGAQEAVYLILQMPLRRSSRSVVFINTNQLSDRVALLKPYNTLKNMAKSSTSIEADNSIKRYQRRPVSMSKYCLVDFIVWFEVVFPKRSKKNDTLDNSDLQSDLLEDDYQEDVVDDPVDISDDTEMFNTPLFDQTKNGREEHPARDGSTFVRRRTCKVFYSVGYSVENDRENYFREMLMLYLPWRKEEDLIGNCKSYEENYNRFKVIIEKNKTPYNNVSSSIITDFGDELFSLTHEHNDMVVPEEQHQNMLDELEGFTPSEMYKSFDPGPPCSAQNYDLSLDIGSTRKQFTANEQIQGILPDDDFCTLVQKLNRKQKEFFYHVLLWHKTKNEPLYNFLTDGAGVGKSVLLTALYQALNKYYSHKVGSCPDDLNVLICAPTGKAAYNVSGITIYSAFNIPVDQGFNFRPLDMQQLGSMQAKYRHLKVIFIDEISMVGQRMFNFINLRLQEIMATTKPFGNVSLIAFGDLYQLKPVMYRWIFSSNHSFNDTSDLAIPL